jgi:hypothetical protein
MATADSDELEELEEVLGRLSAVLSNMPGRRSEGGDEDEDEDDEGYGDDLPQVPRRYNPNRDTELDIGVAAIVHSLKSTRGKQLNGKRCIVLIQLGARWKVQIEGEPSTTALMPKNLKLPTMPVGETHPEYLAVTYWVSKQHENGRRGQPLEENHGNARGVTYASDPPEHRARKLVELLERSTHYTPNKTILYGEALKYYRYLSESSLGDFTVTDMEHFSGLLALGVVCQGIVRHVGASRRDARPDAVVFALLESAPVSLDVLLGFLVITPFIGLQHDFTHQKQEAFSNCRTTADFDDWKLTPDQDSKDYITAMKGPLMILFYISYDFKDTNARLDAAFFHRIEQHVLFPKLLHRLFRLAAREIRNTPDGVELGCYARKILCNMADLDDRMDATMYKMLMQDSNPCWAYEYAHEKLMQKRDVSSYQELFAFLHELLPMDVVDRAKNLALRTRLRYPIIQGMEDAYRFGMM